jgi:hypothetical protein
MTEVAALAPFLRVTRIVDWETPEVAVLAGRLASGRVSPSEVACAAFEWVRDQVLHTVDHARDPVTCSASEVLRAGTGFCYAKSHLLAALLRANGIPAGFVYQRLAAGGATFVLHGLNAVWLRDVGWYRVDPRGNRDHLVSAFNPPREVLPFSCRVAGEQLSTAVWAEPLPIVVEALTQHRTRAALEANLPDAADVDALANTATGPVSYL